MDWDSWIGSWSASAAMGGCNSSHAKGYPDTPYSKKIKKNLVRLAFFSSSSNPA